MKLVSLKCPNCNATLENDDKMAFCLYCGAKLLIDDEVKRSVHTYIKEDVARIKESNNRVRIRAMELAYKSRGSTKDVKFALLAILMIVAIGGVFFSNLHSKSIAEEVQLQKIVDAIEIDIANGEYDSALIKVNSLHYTADWSSEVEEKWTATRETLIKIIEDKKSGG